MPTRARLKLLRTLSRRPARAAEGLYLLEGLRLVDEALRSGAALSEVLVTEAFLGTEAGGKFAARAAAAGVTVDPVPVRELERVAETRTPQGVLAVVRHVEADPAALRGPGVVLALDGVSDPGNVGTLVRAADAFGARAVLAGPGTADFENGKVLRSAMGSTFHVPLLRAPDLAAALAAEKGAGLEVWAAVLDGEDLVGARAGGQRLAVVLGREADGVSADVLAVADRSVTVRCPGRAESLNVAMAGAVILSRLTEVAEAEPA